MKFCGEVTSAWYTLAAKRSNFSAGSRSFQLNERAEACTEFQASHEEASLLSSAEEY
jgi:hypothetical protein